jgi:hypothetical protein
VDSYRADYFYFFNFFLNFEFKFLHVYLFSPVKLKGYSARK